MRKLLALPAIALLLLFSLPAEATSIREIANVEITSPYSFATAEAQKNGVILFTIHNKADADLRITNAYVKPDIADRAELHTHIMDGDKMMMRQVEGYDIPAGEHLTLSPMGDHIMIMDLLAPLALGETIEVTLSFEDGSMAQFEAPVIAAGTKPEGSTTEEAHGHDHQDHSHH
jgi:copper(I)-binding protein